MYDRGISWPQESWSRSPEGYLQRRIGLTGTTRSVGAAMLSCAAARTGACNGPWPDGGLSRNRARAASCGCRSPPAGVESRQAPLRPSRRLAGAEPGVLPRRDPSVTRRSHRGAREIRNVRSTNAVSPAAQHTAICPRCGAPGATCLGRVSHGGMKAVRGIRLAWAGARIPGARDALWPRPSIRQRRR
jgi:hypothetical protein